MFIVNESNNNSSLGMGGIFVLCILGLVFIEKGLPKLITQSAKLPTLIFNFMAPLFILASVGLLAFGLVCGVSYLGKRLWKKVQDFMYRIECLEEKVARLFELHEKQKTDLLNLHHSFYRQDQLLNTLKKELEKKNVKPEVSAKESLDLVTKKLMNGDLF